MWRGFENVIINVVSKYASLVGLDMVTKLKYGHKLNTIREALNRKSKKLIVGGNFIAHIDSDRSGYERFHRSRFSMKLQEMLSTLPLIPVPGALTTLYT